ncbi:MAG: hypothetical protein JNL67_13360 [Planctomycetaceae bacterium]|nr:hypothetical protein [Planctomycetaceae bacterium]
MIRAFLVFMMFSVTAPNLAYSQPQQSVTSITEVTLFHDNNSGGVNVDRIYDCVVSNDIGFTAESYCNNTANHAMKYRLEWTWYRYKWSGSAKKSKVMVEYGSGTSDPVTVAANSETTFVTDEKTSGTFSPILDGHVIVNIRLVSKPVDNSSSGLWLGEATRSGHYHEGPNPNGPGTGPGGPGE